MEHALPGFVGGGRESLIDCRCLAFNEDSLKRHSLGIYLTSEYGIRMVLDNGTTKSKWKVEKYIGGRFFF